VQRTQSAGQGRRDYAGTLRPHVFGQQSKALPQDIGILTAHLVDKEAGLALANTAQTSAVKLD
jgi:hypothetical protein